MRVSSRHTSQELCLLHQSKVRCAFKRLLQCYYNIITMLLQGCQYVLYVNPRSLYVSPSFTADQLVESPHSADSHTLSHTGPLFSKQSGVQCFNMCSPSHSKVQTHPSRMDSRQQYKLSNFCLVTESLTFMAGTHSFPALDSWYSLRGRAGT